MKTLYMRGTQMRLLVAVCFVGLLLACGDDPVKEANDRPTTPTTQLTPCDQLAGLPTMDVVNSACLKADGTQHVNMSMNYDCVDGRKLFWNDSGWGYDNGVWQDHNREDGQLVPPDADMSGCNP